MSSRHADPFCVCKGITKHYGGVTALANVDFSCSLGTIHAVVGENGAGKSSLMKIIAALFAQMKARFIWRVIVQFTSPAEAALLA